jgi:hypothetical protein
VIPEWWNDRKDEQSGGGIIGFIEDYIVVPLAVIILTLHDRWTHRKDDRD